MTSPDMGRDQPSAGPRFALAATCDLNGCFRGKRVAAEALSKLSGGLRMPMSSTGVDIWGTDVPGSSLTLDQGDLDGICEPTGRGPLPLGWGTAEAVFVPLWMRHEDGRPWFGDARRVLAEVLSRFDAKGLRPVVATEVEFHLIDPAAARAEPIFPAHQAHTGSADRIYALAELGRVSAFFDEVYASAEACGIALDAAISESGPAQFEVNLMHGDALRVADDTLLFKQILRNAAERHGHAATFMAKPYPDTSGNGLHVHFSLLDGQGANLFDNGGPEGTAMLRHAVAGMIEAMPDCTAIFAPHANSYRRLCPGSLAPTTAAWGYENRTTALRIPGGPTAARRIEHRVAGVDANPYLVLAAILAAALDGITRQAEPPAPVRGNAYAQEARSLAAGWREAVRSFATSPLVARLLPAELIATFSACKSQEIAVFDRDISDFEYATYLRSL